MMYGHPCKVLHVFYSVSKEDTVSDAESSRLRPGKRRAILSAAHVAFARDGYVRASIETIAGEAGVSTRTVYKHFRDKSALFQTVIEESAARVAKAQLAIVDRFFPADALPPADLHAQLTAFALEWTRPLPSFREHEQLVERVRAEVGHVPPEGIEAWQNAGPTQVRRALAGVFERLAQQGRLRTADPYVTATHFARLVAVADPLRPSQRLTTKQAAEVVTGGVGAFLYGYQTKDPQ
jgi:AcrR family transcriptional regulator